jgi:serine O-acetyltransferase
MSHWREDLLANANRQGIKGVIAAWIMNPGFVVATYFRIAHWGRANAGLLGKIVSILSVRHLVKRYGCYIDPKVEIGTGVRFPHPVGIVIGEGTVIGTHATIYQNVTFGRRSAGQDHYPVIGDHVTAYAGATIVGDVHIGDNAIVGAHALVREHIPDGGIAQGEFAHVKTR